MSAVKGNKLEDLTVTILQAMRNDRDLRNCKKVCKYYQGYVFQRPWYRESINAPIIPSFNILKVIQNPSTTKEAYFPETAVPFQIDVHGSD